MKRDKILILVGIFLVAIILSSIHQGYREGMSHHKEEELKGEKHAGSLIETDIEHKEQTMQDSNQYSHDKLHNKWNGDDSEDDSEDDNWDDKDDTRSEQNIYGPGGEEWPPHHHKHHHKSHHKHHKHHNKQHHKHHHKQHHNEESMNTMNDDSINDDNMYVLKSEVVPPICPTCPQTTACPKKKPCPPCPPCARCPDNNFECKKVPNYEGGNSSLFPANMFGPGSSSSNEDDDSAPQPYLNSFAQF